MSKMRKILRTTAQWAGMALAGLALLPGLFLLAGCSSVPVTGRKAVSLVSDEEVAKMSMELFEDMKRQFPISHDRQQNEMLQRVGSRISEVVFWDVPNAKWEFVVFSVPGEVNAFAMAGGKVGVFSGAFDVATTDDELAVIVAHEIAHVSAKHVHEKLSQEMLVQTGGLAVAVTTGGLAGAAAGAAYQLGSGMVGLSFDRGKEREADRIGLIYMAKAGFNPRAAFTLWEKIDQLQMSSGSAAPPEWLSTHPSHVDRMVGLREIMPRAEEYYEKAKASGSSG